MTGAKTGGGRTILAAAVLLSLACVPALADTPAPPPPRQFADACGSCHENNGFGMQVLAARLGPERASLRREPALPAAYIRMVVRNGLGAMPAMSRVEVTDGELLTIIAELTRGSTP